MKRLFSRANGTMTNFIGAFRGSPSAVVKVPMLARARLWGRALCAVGEAVPTIRNAPCDECGRCAVKTIWSQRVEVRLITC